MEYLYKLRGLDLMSTPISFKVDGHSGLKTWFGVFLTGVYVSCVFAASWIIFKTFTDTTSPTIFQETSESSQFPKVDLLESQILPSLFVYTRYGAVIQSTDIYRYFTPVVVKSKFWTEVYPNGTSELKTEFMPMNMLPCQDLIKNPSMAAYYSKYVSTVPAFQSLNKEGLCVEPLPDYMNIVSNSSGRAEFFSVDLLPCTLPMGCATQQELRQLSLVFVQPKMSLNLSNYENPTELIISQDKSFGISDNVFQSLTYSLTTTEVEDASDFFSQKVTRARRSNIPIPSIALISRDPSQITCTFAEIMARTCTPYISFMFTSSGTKTKIVRTYKGMIKTLSEIGGISSFVLALCFQLSQIYTYFMKNRILVHLVFTFLASKAFLKTIALDIAKKQPPLAKNYTKTVGTSSVDEGSMKSAKKEVARMEKEATDLITNSLDIVTILTEINNIKFLVSSLLKEHQRNLIPLSSISQHEEEMKRKKSKVGRKASVGPRGTVKPSTSFQDLHLTLSSRDPESAYSEMLFSLLKNRTEVSAIDNRTDISRLSLPEVAGLSLQRGIQSLSPAFASLKDASIGQEEKGGNAIVINGQSENQDTYLKKELEGSESRVLEPSQDPLTTPLQLPNSPRSTVNQSPSPNALNPPLARPSQFSKMQSPSEQKIEVFQPVKTIQPIRKVFNNNKNSKKQN